MGYGKVSLPFSKSKIDRSGVLLSSDRQEDIEKYIESEGIFDEFRKVHLAPLTKLTLYCQSWLKAESHKYYIAQRLKRKPQILRKLNRFSVRLTQLQDVGGLRIIASDNKAASELQMYLSRKIESLEGASILRTTDYRERGRDVTGYRAIHIIVNIDGVFIEVQIRSEVQHYWAELIERTSVVYGYHLKEQEGDARVLRYFKLLSDMFFEIEAGRQPDSLKINELDKVCIEARDVIERSDKRNILGQYVDSGIISTLVEVEKSNGSDINNWLIVFDWSIGSFITWDIVGRGVDEAVESYIEKETQFSQGNFEVVLIGSSDVATIEKTHSHYFGIHDFDQTIQNVEGALAGLSGRTDMDVGAREILGVMYRKKYWGKNGVQTETLKNHFCRNVLTFESSLQNLYQKDFVQVSAGSLYKGVLSLNPKMRTKIDKYI